MESEGIKAVKYLVTNKIQGKNILDNLHNHHNQSKRLHGDESK